MRSSAPRKKTDMTTRRFLGRPVPAGDDGVGLVMVVGTMMVATAFALLTLGYAMNTQEFSGKNQSWHAAAAAAQAGIDDYIGYLNRNDNYARLPEDCTNVALRGPRTIANPCGWNASTPVGWKPVDSGDSNGPAFHYDIDPSRLESHGVVEVTSTGRVGDATRTLQVGVGRGGSTQFLYYTDHEDADPDNEAVYPSGMPSRCYKYWWDGRRTNGSGCQEITFIGGDVLDGAVHTNDTPLMTSRSGVKPKFLQGLETSDPKCRNAVPGNPSTYDECDRTGNGGDYGSSWPTYSAPKYLPDNSDQFRNYPGCHYKGATRIKFLADGTMQVWSSETTPGTADCGGNRPAGAVVNVPNDKVIYVAAGTSGEHRCRSGEIGDGLPLGNYTGNDRVAYQYDMNMTYQTQYCGRGNAYVEGVLKGRVTVAASNSITVTGDLVMARGLQGTDMLGLVAANSVEVMHPWMDDWECKESSSSRCSRSDARWGWDGSPAEQTTWPRRYTDPDRGAAYPSPGIGITASIQTLQHSFFVQSYNRGTPRGKLYVKGSIAQSWRGIVGTNNSGGSLATGYLKDYQYDKRLRYASPPYFPQWTNAVWAANYTGEVAPQYRS
jgi:hypothetical protein